MSDELSGSIMAGEEAVAVADQPPVSAAVVGEQSNRQLVCCNFRG